MMENKFLIFALPRTGSSTLLQILNLHEDIKCVYEPFNVDKRYYKFEKDIEDENQLTDAINFIYSKNNGIKHIWNTDGWPFLKQPSLNKSILLKGGKIIFLQRKNILQRIVSCQISWQTNLWDKEDKDKIANHRFTMLDAELIKLTLENEKNYLQEWKDYLKNSHIDFMEVYYEDIFSNNLSFDEKLKVLDNIFSFLGYPRSSDLCLIELKKLVDTSNKMSSDDLYLNIPKIKKIDARFGSDETGRLFNN